MKLKATRKWNNEPVLIKPVFYDWHVGIEYKSLTGYKHCSIFTEKANAFIFPIETKIIVFFIKIGYWFRFYLWKRIRYTLIWKIKRRFF